MANEMQKANMARLNGVLNNATMQQKFKNVLAENAGPFMASIIDLYGNDAYLQRCDPDAVVMKALEAATLKLPISKNLGFAYIIPYGNVPQFQIGYKGFIQLAQRTGQYKYINADVVYEGQTVHYDIISGMLQIEGEPKSDKAIGYFAYFKLLNGFEKAVYWTKARVEAHAKRYSQAYRSGKSDTPWINNFDAMALKTVLKNLITKYGVISIEFASVIEKDQDDVIEAEVIENANKDVLSLDQIAGGKNVEVEPEGSAPAPVAPAEVDETEPDF